ncbi:MAG TPA: hypothetical protein VEG27_02265 [Usitatibacter sp.]|nr:hypothetical protein [Usitatibacter sp.]
MSRANAVARWGLVAAALLVVAACGKSEAPKAAADPAAERAAARERAKHEAFGADVKALEKAENLGADLNKKAEENLQKADQ